MNVVMLIGNLAKDGELRATKDGTSVFSFTLAVNRGFKKEEGKSDVDFINCSSFGKTADTMAKYLTKGSKIGVQGRLQVSKFKDKENQIKYQTSVLVDKVSFLGNKKESTKEDTAPTKSEVLKSILTDDDLMILGDDELPF